MDKAKQRITRATRCLIVGGNPNIGFGVIHTCISNLCADVGVIRTWLQLCANLDNTFDSPHVDTTYASSTLSLPVRLGECGKRAACHKIYLVLHVLRVYYVLLPVCTTHYYYLIKPSLDAPTTSTCVWPFPIFQQH